MADVYIWPACLGTETDYGSAVRIKRSFRLGGGPAKDVEIQPRAPIILRGEATRSVRPDLDIMISRLDGGGYVGIWDLERHRFGWDGYAAINSSGAEFWKADGQVSAYAGESANPPTGPWRSIFATLSGAHTAGTRSLSLAGLLASEVIPKGCPLRIGDYPYTALAAATADGAGAATLSIAEPLRANETDATQVRIPGDFAVCKLVAKNVAPTTVEGVTSFELQFREVYSTEVSGGFSYTVD